jgi:hypothetical protein
VPASTRADAHTEEGDDEDEEDREEEAREKR